MKRKSRVGTNISMNGNEELANIFRSFSHVDRLMILNTLGSEEMPLITIAGKLQADSSMLTPHFRALKKHGILLSRKRDGRTLYRLLHPRLLKALDLIEDMARSKIGSGFSNAE